jgi:uncharacterized protein (DUF697 family)
VYENARDWLGRNLKISGWLSDFWTQTANPAAAPDAMDAAGLKGPTAHRAPVIWLLGKSGSGKTSIVAALTGHSHALIGEGFRPCTTHSRIYDWPAEMPVLRFLDTRGLGEAGYDPTEDMAEARAAAHVLLVTMRVGDAVQDPVLETVRQVRAAHPDWPVVVAQTALHRHYPRGADHPSAYPYRGTDADDALADVPLDLRMALTAQRRMFERLRGAPPRFVPIDLTRPEDGYNPVDFGAPALTAALADAGVDVLLDWERERVAGENDAIAREAHGLVLGYAAAAVASGAVPVPLVGVGGLAGTIGLMLQALAGRYGVDWTPERMGALAGALGTGVLVGVGVRYGIAELAKLVPGVGTIAGVTLNSAAAGLLVYAVGRAACVYLGMVRKNEEVSAETIRRSFDEAFRRGMPA